MSVTKNLYHVAAAVMGLLGCMILFSGCSSSNKEEASIFNPDTGRHITGWASPAVHGVSAKSQPDGFSSCQECHGTDYAGGISTVACSSCHGVNAPHAPAPWRGGTYTHTTTDQGNAPVCAQCHTNGANSSLHPVTPAPAGTAPGCFNNTLCHAVVGHPAGWNSPDQHGAAAKAQPSSSAGFALCETCHGSDFSGGLAQTSCFVCHGGSGPHPTSWITGTYTHTTTNTGNAPVCALCHTNGANSPIAPPSPPAPAGTGPGCFNNTLCHAQVGHPAGWSDPTQHGVAAKAAPTASGGFPLCQTCHGNDFSGGIVQTACSSCHGGSAPHPTSWVTGTYTHTTTDTGNAVVCALCHTNGANSPIAPPSPPATAGTPPGCFNSTLCHAQAGHPAGWSDPTQHGVSAKAAPNPSTTSGFSTCQTCHGNDFSGGTASTACDSCHGGSAPHPVSWITGTYTHTNTDTGNATVCALCHTNGANSPIAPPSPPAPAGTAPGCFNSTLCHATPTCGSCHGIPPNGSTFPNVAGSHAPHMSANASVACSTCHLGAGSGTALHENGVVDVILDTTYNATSGAAAYAPASLTCSNIACHGSSRTQNATQAASRTSTPGPTPVWGSGTIDVNTQCTACHVIGPSAGSPENNSYYSGRHYLHVWDPTDGPQPKLACTACHDTTKLAVVHFTSLTAPISEATASTTTKSSLNFNGTSCSPGCHGNETW